MLKSKTTFETSSYSERNEFQERENNELEQVSILHQISPRLV